MASERESGQQSIWEHRETEGGPGQPAPAPREAPGEPRLQTVTRQQMAWRVVDVEQLIAEDHPARAIWQLVGKLDLSSFYKSIGAVEGEAGRPALDPQLLISLWIYGYSEGVSSAREIARLCEFDPAYHRSDRPTLSPWSLSMADRPATISTTRLGQSDHGDNVGLSDLQHSTVDSSPLARAIGTKNGVRT